MHEIEVSHNWAGWLDRPTLHPAGILLTSAGEAGCGGRARVLECLDLASGRVVFDYSVEAISTLEVIPSRPLVLANGEILLSVYAKDQYLQLLRLDPQGRLLSRQEWTDEQFPELYGADVSCKLFPGRVGQAGSRYYASWLYRQGRQLRTALAESDLQMEEWAVGDWEGFIITSDGKALTAWNPELSEEALWIRPGFRYLAAPLWIYDSRERDEERQQRALDYVEHAVTHNLGLNDFPEELWDEQHPLQKSTWVRSLDPKNGEATCSLECPGELKSFASDTQGWALCYRGKGWHCLEDGCPVAVPDIAIAPCPLGRQRGRWHWLLDSTLALLPEGNQRGLPCEARGFSPWLKERDLAWADLILSGENWILRSGSRLYWAPGREASGA